ncbi:MAG: hypothetical protein Hens2KO_16070 [Henriciella sp.]
MFDGCENVIVDFDCPENTGTWAESHTDAILVQMTDRPNFSLSEARNAGARNASGEFLFFIDADTILTPEFFEQVFQTIDESSFVSLRGRSKGQGGVIVAPAKAFLDIGGYDEVFSGWGVEDNDIYLRLSKILEPRFIEASLAGQIDHGDSKRTENYTVESINQSEQRNELYRRLRSVFISYALDESSLPRRRRLMSLAGKIQSLTGTFILRRLLNLILLMTPENKKRQS